MRSATTNTKNPGNFCLKKEKILTNKYHNEFAHYTIFYVVYVKNYMNINSTFFIYIIDIHEDMKVPEAVKMTMTPMMIDA